MHGLNYVYVFIFIFIALILNGIPLMTLLNSLLVQRVAFKLNSMGMWKLLIELDKMKDK